MHLGMGSTIDEPAPSTRLPAAQPGIHLEVTQWARQDFPKDFEALPDVAGLTFQPLVGHLIQGAILKKFQNPSSHMLRVGVNGKISPRHGVMGVFAYIDNAKTDSGEQYLAIRYICKEDNYTIISASSIVWEEPFSKMAAFPSYGEHIKALICWYFLAMGYLDKIDHYDSFTSNFKAACARMRTKSNTSGMPKKQKSALPPVRKGASKSAKLPKPLEQKVEGHKKTTDLREARDESSTPESPVSRLKRIRREEDEVWDQVEENNKHLKIENGELQVKNEQQAGEIDRLRQELADEKHARTVAEQRVIQEMARAEQADQTTAVYKTQIETEKASTVQALGEKAWLEIRLRALESGQRP
ncbi:hypothetical protein P171DRAFT_467888 [Karstenula rhodostoma CBS 690.94]|uniref:Uncharacterized protein n=1 Tax=Karstenula rhodostoma CBS 690.94 TaxID=1392251 RepID=A0A9P4PYN2_9PLEO|nr:hypothetical protein P171DRAFT_467888 [Karstenula rhodostoma CBS 690.94]